MVTDQSAGLRFDIYEKVQLSEEIEGIEQLDDIELVPRIQLITEGDQAILKGDLRLSGNYLSGQDLRNRQEFEYLIPVEITLPMNRIEEVKDIGVEIENFDVDLLSSRSMNVTGVLSLKGVGVQPSYSEQYDAEDTVFVHQSEELNPTVEDNEEPTRSSVEVEEEQSSDIIATDLTDSKAQPQEEQEEQDEQAVQKDQLELEEKSEKLKIAFSSKKAHTEEEEQPLEKLKLHSKEPLELKAAEKQDADTDSPDSSEEKSRTGEVAWKSLFLSRDDEETNFSKMRMCIVQKEETIDTIAERYSLNTREIILYNRLEDQDVAEGQIIYIPN